MSFRAVEILSSVELIAAEDTRHAGILLKHYEIQTPTTSFYDFNKEKKTPVLIHQIKAGESIALISDAGTPGISDPAFYIVREAIKENISIEAIPGATAFVPALIISGLPTDRFVFEGFLPPKKGRQTRLKELAEEKRTIIIYESPKKILKTLSHIREYLGNRRISISRELTKKFEETYHGSLDDVYENPDIIKTKGEFVIVIEGKASFDKAIKNH
ncbi:16S rRNA (cytidine(1402)-2'-O)-methyltransferase [candidate division KSB1 bacterium]|nr:16S rRNA (cytidine(1402)-2'-O)-methyltransferase [candidate division KSB1 bacterium]